MDSFRDSTDQIDDGPALAQTLEADGYLFLRGVIPTDAVVDVRARLLRHAAAGGWLQPGGDPSEGLANFQAACKDPEPAYLEVFRGMWMDEALHRLRHHPNIIELFERIFGEKVLVHPLFVLRNIFPQTEAFDFTTPPHQDRIHIGGGRNFALWAPIGDCPIEKGPLSVAAGSHRDGILDFEIGNGAGGLQTSNVEALNWSTGAFAAGDVLIFEDTLVHHALPNRTDRIRQSFDARYQKASLPIADLCMRTYADMMTWEEVYEGWDADDLKYYWREQNPTVAPYDTQYYEKRDAIAFDMAERGDRKARDTLLRVIQRDTDPEKRARAERLLDSLDAA